MPWGSTGLKGISMTQSPCCMVLPRLFLFPPVISCYKTPHPILISNHSSLSLTYPHGQIKREKEAYKLTVEMRRLVVILLLIVSVVTLSIQCVFGQSGSCGSGGGGAKCTGNNCCSKYSFCGTGSSYCGSGCQKSYGKCSGSCFPGSAMVTTRNGAGKSISELEIGEEVASWTSQGKVEYSAVYNHGHYDSIAFSQFVVLKLSSMQYPNETKTLELSPDHFAMVAAERNGAVQYKRAKDVEVGDKMLVATPDDGRSHFTSSFYVSDVKMEMLKGLYNPFTLGGNIVVNNVVASCHSGWFLDSAFDGLHLSHMLPSTYQMLLAPVRMLYRGMGKDSYKRTYAELDSRFDFARSGTSMGGYTKILAASLYMNYMDASKQLA